MGLCQGRDRERTLSTHENLERLRQRADPTKGIPVYINVYDLLIMNYTTSKFGVGVYHTGVVIFDYEYCFSGHIQCDPMTGREISGLRRFRPPGDTSWIEDAIFKETLLMGYTDYNEFEVAQIFTELKLEFPGPSYNVLGKNCNHFTRRFLERLLNRESLALLDASILPAYVSRIVRVANKMRPCMPAILTTDLRDQPYLVTGRQQTI